MTDAGQLQGEIPLGYYRVRRRSRASTASRRRSPRRCCTSSSATTARSSTARPVVPCTREATLVHMIDNLGGRLGSFDRLEKELADGQAWSAFDRALGSGAVLRRAARGAAQAAASTRRGLSRSPATSLVPAAPARRGSPSSPGRTRRSGAEVVGALLVGESRRGGAISAKPVDQRQRRAQVVDERRAGARWRRRPTQQLSPARRCGRARSRRAPARSRSRARGCAPGACRSRCARGYGPSRRSRTSSDATPSAVLPSAIRCMTWRSRGDSVRHLGRRARREQQPIEPRVDVRTAVADPLDRRQQLVDRPRLQRVPARAGVQAVVQQLRVTGRRCRGSRRAPGARRAAVASGRCRCSSGSPTSTIAMSGST